MKELLLEIGTEEIPAGFIPQALNDLENLARKELETNRIDFDNVRSLGTPRRLVLFVGSVSERQRDWEEKKIGPSKQAAFDQDGNPTRAAVGFAKGQSVPVASLQVVQTEKGEYVCATKREAGKPTADLLPLLFPRVILSIPFQKSMRWADVPIRFVRPIHWILALFGGETVPFEVGNVRSGNVTHGHRFMRPGAIPVEGFQDYLKKTKEAFVLVDPGERKKKIEEEMAREETSLSGQVLKDEELLDEVSFLVEYPVALRGGFDAKFLSLPREVLIHSMKEHQRYFPIVDRQGRLFPQFICISNIAPSDQSVVIKGNERVLRARLADASYFFREDMKVPLEKRVEQLKQVVFQAKLGTSYEKMSRFKQLASWMTKRIEPGLKEKVERAALLCKADLVTGMVGEFPKLQGAVGREYARLSGEAPEVAEAIYEHYLPAFAGDRLPGSPIGDIVSMADKMDTIVGCFGVGLAPTGTADPFGLRRQTLGILRIILEKGYPLSLVELIEQSLSLLREKMERPLPEVKQDVHDFFRTRFQYLLLDRGYPADVVDAVLCGSFDDPVDVQHRIDALKEARAWGDFESIVVAFKRAMNILKGVQPSGEVDPGLLDAPAERNLYQTYLRAKEEIDRLLEEHAYEGALLEMMKMRKPIDDFFEGVMVMVQDEGIKQNRLALLDRIGALFLRMGDFSRLA